MANVHERLAARKAQQALLGATRTPVVGSALPTYDPSAPVRERVAARKARKAIFSARQAQSSQPSPQEAAFSPTAPGQVLGGAARSAADWVREDLGRAAAGVKDYGQGLGGFAQGAVAHVPETVANIGRSLGIVPEGQDTRLDWMGRRIAGEEAAPPPRLTSGPPGAHGAMKSMVTSVSGQPETDTDRIASILDRNRGKDFVERIINPQEGLARPDLGEGWESSHLMSWGEADGKFIVYPEIVRDKNTGALSRLPRDKAASYALQSGEFIPFDTADEADWFSKNYKRIWDTHAPGAPEMPTGAAERATRIRRGAVGAGRTFTGLLAAPLTIPIGIGGALGREVGAGLQAMSTRGASVTPPPGHAVGTEARNLLMGMVPAADAVPRMAEAYYAAQTPRERDRVLSEFLAVEGPGLIAAIPAGYGMLRHEAARVSKGVDWVARKVRQRQATAAPASPQAAQPPPESPVAPAPEATQAPIPTTPPTIASPPGVPPEAVTPQPRPRRPKVQAPVILEAASPPAAVAAGPEPSLAPALPPDVSRETGEMTPVDLGPPPGTVERRTPPRLTVEARSIIPLEDQFKAGDAVDFMVKGKGFVRGTVEGFGTDETGNPVPLVRYGGQTYKAGEMEGIRPAEGEPPPAPLRHFLGQETEVRTESQAIPARWSVVDASDLKTSFDAGYPKDELQPRDTDRLASKVRISRMAGNIDPELLAESALAADGAPVVGPDLAAYTGNHRIEAIREAYANHPEQAGRYRKMVEARAARYGVEVPAGVKQPVLVRVEASGLKGENRRRFVEEANAPSAATMSATERARQDAGRLDAETLGAMSVPEDGNLLAASNAGFMRMFAARVVPAAELGAFVGPKGELTPDGLRRVQNAIFEKAYGNAELLGRASESLDDSVRNLTKALLQAAPRFASIADAIKAGSLYDLTIAPQIALATETVARLRERGETVDGYMKQFTFDERDPVIDTLVQLLGDTNLKIAGTNPSRSPRLLGEVLRNYADAVEAAGDPKQAALFESVPPTREELLLAAINRTKQENGEAPSLFTEEAPHAKPTSEAPQHPRPPAVDRTADRPPPPEAPGPGAQEGAAVGAGAGAKPASLTAEARKKRGEWAKTAGADQKRLPSRLASPLPAELSRSSPRYGYRDGNYTLSFSGGDPGDINRAIYIVTDPKKSRQHGKFADFLEANGVANVKERGAAIRDEIKAKAKRFRDGGYQSGEIIVEGKALPPKPRPASRSAKEPVEAFIPRNDAEELADATKALPPGWKARREFDGSYTLRKGDQTIRGSLEAGTLRAWEAEGQQNLFGDPGDQALKIHKAAKQMELEGFAQGKTSDGEEVQAFSPLRKNYVAPKPGGAVAREVRGVNDMVRALVQAADLPVRKGRFQKKRALGIFKVHSEVIRWKDKPGQQMPGVPEGVQTKLATISHEIGHAISKRAFGRNLKSAAFPSISPRTAAMAPELLRVAAARYQGKPSYEEGFAEVHRLYVTDHAAAMREAPETVKFLDEWLPQNWKPLHEADLAVRDDLPRYNATTPEERIKAETSYEENAGPTATFSDWRTRIMDRVEPVHQVVKEIEQARGSPIASRDNPETWIRNLAAWSDKADVMRMPSGKGGRRFGFSADTEVPGGTLGDIYQEVWKDRRDFDAYLIARRAPAYAEKAPGDPGFPTGRREMALPLSQAEYQKAAQNLEAKYPHFRAAADRIYDFKRHLMEYARDAGGPGDDVIAKLALIDPFHVPFYRLVEQDGGGMFGPTKGKIVNLGSLIKRKKGGTEKIISPTESLWKNVAVIVSWAERNAAAAKLVDLIESTQGMGGKSEAVPKALSPDKVDVRRVLEEAGIDPHDPVMADLQAAGMQNYITMFRPSIFEKDPNTVVVWKNGEPTLHTLDAGLKDALTLPAEAVPEAFKLLAIPARTLGTGVTATYGFAFVRNPIKDQISAFNYSKYGYKPGIDFVRGAYHVLTGSKDYTDAKIAGAFNSEFMAYARKYLQEDMEAAMRPKLKTFGHYLVSPVQALVKMSLVSERATRLMETKRGLEVEGHDRPGFMAAGAGGREVSVDFARHGAQTAALSSIARFWNAQMQGLDRMGREMKQNPTQFATRAAISITLPSLLLWWANHNDPRYKHLDKWKKDIAWPVFVGDSIYWIPKPFEMGIIFGSFPERMADKVVAKDPRAFDGWAESLSRQIPVPYPTALVPLIENWANQSLFLARPIVPEREDKLEPKEQFGPETSRAARAVGGVLNYSPRKIENLVRGYTGSMGQTVMHLPDLLYPAGERPQARTLPEILLPGVAGRYPRYAGEEVDRFYRQAQAAESAEATFKRLMAGERRDEAMEYLPGARQAAGYREGVEALAEINAAIRRVNEDRSLDPTEKRNRMDELKIRRNEMAERFLAAADSQAERRATP